MRNWESGKRESGQKVDGEKLEVGDERINKDRTGAKDEKATGRSTHHAFGRLKGFRRLLSPQTNHGASGGLLTCDSKKILSWLGPPVALEIVRQKKVIRPKPDAQHPLEASPVNNNLAWGGGRAYGTAGGIRRLSSTLKPSTGPSGGLGALGALGGFASARPFTPLSKIHDAGRITVSGSLPEAG